MRKLLLLAGLLLTLGACKKKEDTAPTPLTRTQLLTGKTWGLTAATLTPGITYMGLTFTDGYQALSLGAPCQIDNTQRFELPNVYTINEGANVCAGSPATSTGTWALSADGNTLTTVVSGLTTTYTVISVTDTELKASYPFAFLGQATTISATFTKK